jgi:hypothetical protein
MRCDGLQLCEYGVVCTRGFRHASGLGNEHEVEGDGGAAGEEATAA